MRRLRKADRDRELFLVSRKRWRINVCWCRRRRGCNVSSSRTSRNYTVTLPAPFDVTWDGASAGSLALTSRCKHTFPPRFFSPPVKSFPTYSRRAAHLRAKEIIVRAVEKLYTRTLARLRQKSFGASSSKKWSEFRSDSDMYRFPSYRGKEWRVLMLFLYIRCIELFYLICIEGKPYWDLKNN